MRHKVCKERRKGLISFQKLLLFEHKGEHMSKTVSNVRPARVVVIAEPSKTGAIVRLEVSPVKATRTYQLKSR
jgi:hypothetical protein